MIGLYLSQYRIDAELGRGGMGIVYRATDTKLNRAVALKVLPAAALGSEDDRARFFREAQAAAQLHHPNIATVFGIDEAVPHAEGKEPQEGAERRPFIAMEFIEGETLHEHVKKGPLRLPEAVSIAVQVAEALKAAHAKNIVHRDIKSANVMLTPDGVAKVLDFGLAKTNQSTMLTRMGSTLGTVAYMSPEQARGQEVDGRSDLYSLGTVLYEMVTGRLPFAGDYEQAVVYGILNETPEPLTSLRTGVPMELERIVGKLLTKEADYRYQGAADLIADLKSLDVSGSGRSQSRVGVLPKSGAGTKVAAGSKAMLPTWVLASLVVAALVVGAVGSWLLASPPAPDPAPVREMMLALDPSEGVTNPTIAPDGTFLVYVARDSAGQGVFLYRFDGRPSTRLPFEVSGWMFRISTDSKTILAADPLTAYSIETGAVTVLDARSARGFGLLRMDRPEYVVVGQSSGLEGRPLDGSAPREITRLAEGEFSHARMSLLPDGRALMVNFTAANVDSTTIEIVDLDTGARQVVLTQGVTPFYVPTGHLLFIRGTDGRTLLQRFDYRSGAVSGPAIDLGPRFQGRSISFDDRGTAVVGRVMNLVQADGLGVVFRSESDGKGGQIPPAPTGGQAGFSASSDGRRMSFTRQETGEIEVFEADRREPRWTIRADPTRGTAILSPSGDRIAYFEVGSLGRAIAVQELATGRLHRVELAEPGAGIDWTAEGVIAYNGTRDTDDPNIVGLDPATGTELWRVPVPLRTPRNRDWRFDVSPDGRWVAVGSISEVGLWLVPTDGSAGPTQIAGQAVRPDGGWTPDGKRLWLGDPTWRPMYIDLQLDGSRIVEVGPVTEHVFNLGMARIKPIENGALLIYASATYDAGAGVLLIENWFEEVRRLLPPGD